MKIVISTALAVLLTACATTHMDESALPLTGYWYGEVELENNQTRKWVIARHTDGTYWASFECIENTHCGPIKEHGIWGIEDNVYWVKTMLLIDEAGGPHYPDTDDKMYHSNYTLTGMSEDYIEYQHVETKKTYRTQRVSKSFAAEFEDSKLGRFY